MRMRAVALACGALLMVPFAARGMPAAIHIIGGGTGVASCATILPVFPNLGPPAPAPVCLGTATGSIVGRTPANTIVDWHTDYGGCGLLCGAFAATVAYADICPGGVEAVAGGAAGSVTITGEGDGDAGIETLHVDYALARAGSAFEAVLFGGYIDMDGDSPGAPDLDSDVAFHDVVGLSGDAVGNFLPAMVPPSCATPGPLGLTVNMAAEFRGA